jgi:pimeloyl-ACP methyl ester carboxylesterase
VKEIMMNRRSFAFALATGAATAALPRAGNAQGEAVHARNVVLVHGAYADGSCWSEVIGRLQKAGLRATAVQHPLTTLEAGVEATRRALALQDGPTVLVGHSFAGMIVSEAGVDPKVLSLVYVAARAPDAGEDYTALAKTYPTPPATAGLVWSQGYGRLDEEAFLRDFAGDIPAARARILYAVQGPVSDKLFAGKTTQAAWRSKPSWYAVSTEDRTINPDLERFMAKRMKAKTIEVKASHLSLISHPETITKLILEAAAYKG